MHDENSFFFHLCSFFGDRIPVAFQWRIEWNDLIESENGQLFFPAVMRPEPSEGRHSSSEQLPQGEWILACRRKHPSQPPPARGRPNPELQKLQAQIGLAGLLGSPRGHLRLAQQAQDTKSEGHWIGPRKRREGPRHYHDWSLTNAFILIGLPRRMPYSREQNSKSKLQTESASRAGSLSMWYGHLKNSSSCSSPGRLRDPLCAGHHGSASRPGSNCSMHDAASLGLGSEG